MARGCNHQRSKESDMAKGRKKTVHVRAYSYTRKRAAKKRR